MAALLLAHPRIDAVFTINDPTALGADLAARQARRREFFIVSIDGAPAAVEALHDEDSLIAATAAQDPRMMATRGVEIGYALMNGVEPAQNPTLIPTPLVTRENADAYKGWAGE
jgi:ribose transport system substrate-binding protein